MLLVQKTSSCQRQQSIAFFIHFSSKVGDTDIDDPVLLHVAKTCLHAGYNVRPFVRPSVRPSVRLSLCTILYCFEMDDTITKQAAKGLEFSQMKQGN